MVGPPPPVIAALLLLFLMVAGAAAVSVVLGRFMTSSQIHGCSESSGSLSSPSSTSS